MLIKWFQRLSAYIWRTLFSMWDIITYGISKTIFILQYIFLGLVCVLVDYLVSVPIIHNSDYTRALVDTLGHALIGGLSWLIVVGIHKEGILQGIGCSLMSSAIDLDHFLMARSLNLKDALSLKSRPPLHTSTIIPIITPILQVWCAQHIQCLHDLPYMFVVAVLSHHLRDAQRRGLWFWPMGSTPPLPYGIYIVSISLLPMVVKDVRVGVKRLSSSSNKPVLPMNNIVENI